MAEAKLPKANVPTTPLLLSELEKVISWRELGMYLGIPLYDIKAIHNDYIYIENCKAALFQRYLHMRGSESTWDDIVNALECMDMIALAEKLRDKYIYPSAPTVSVEEELIKSFATIWANFGKVVADVKKAIHNKVLNINLKDFLKKYNIEPATIETVLDSSHCSLLKHDILHDIVETYFRDKPLKLQYDSFEDSFTKFQMSRSLRLLASKIKTANKHGSNIKLTFPKTWEKDTTTCTLFKEFVEAYCHSETLHAIEAVKEVSGNMKVSLITLHGPPGAGKTSLKRLLLGKPPLPPEQQNSTPVVDQPARVVTTSKLGLKSDDSAEHAKLENIDETKLIELLAGHIQHLMQADSTSSESPAIEPPTDQVEVVQSDSSSALPPSSDQMTNVLKTLVKNLKQIDQSHSGNIFDMHWFHIIDSGGQPQFQDVLPLLFHTQSLHIVVIRLSERLDDKPKFCYIREGKKLECLPSRLTLTNFQIIERTCQLAQASSNGHEPPWVMVVGTHLDHINKCDETLEEKNKQLKQLHEKYRDVLITRNEEDTIFSINAMVEVGFQRQQYTDELQQIIIEAPTLPDSHPVPIKWLVFEIEISRVSSQNKGILSIDDCYKVADTLEMIHKEADDALKYFTEVVTHLYYPDVLPHLLFTQMSPVVDRLSALISTSFTHSKVVPIGKQHKLQHEGIFNKAYLKHCGQATTVHFTDDDFLKLLEYLYIAVHVGEDNYFLPCALSISDDQDCQPSPSCDPLVFTWDGQILPHSFYPTLITNLLQQESVFTLIKEQKRHRVYLKCPQKLSGAICIVDATLWLELHYYGKQEYCPKIRSMIEKSISEVSRILRLPYMATPQLGFICNGLICGMSIDRHICALTDGTCEATCSIGIDTSTVTNNRQLCWLQETGLQNTSDNVSDKIKQLRKSIEDVINSKFADLAGLLGPKSTLELFAKHLLQEKIITKDIVHAPTYDNIMNCFLATLPVLETIDAIQDHCKNFLQALGALGSSGAISACEALRDGWRKAADKIGYKNFLST